VAPPPGRAKAADFPPSNAQVNGIEKDAEKLRRDKQAGGMKASK
jgi:outer membrane murein-binding lipoprotein Lpp|tara:strand:+ start:502 stop:633 length:132 start_codon:yes stop_codon:yes gene_type:complete